MLYHFPDESPKDLTRKERELLQREVDKSRYVEKYGYRRKESTLPSFFVEWKCIDEYLKCPIDKWSWPATSADKVELQPIPSEFLPPVTNLLKPLKYFDPVSKEFIRRVAGFREIQQKREYLSYLRDIEEILREDTSTDSDSEDDGKSDAVCIKIDDEDEEVMDDKHYYSGHENDHVSYRSGPNPVLNIARGGGKKKEEKEKDAKKDKDKEKDTGKEKETRKDKEKKKGKSKETKNEDKRKGSDSDNKKPGIFSKIWNYFTNDDESKNKEDTKSKEKKGKDRKDDKKKDEKERKDDKKKDEKERKDDKKKDEKERKDDKKKDGKERKDDEKKDENDGVKSRKWGLARIWKDLNKQKYGMHKDHQDNLEALFRYHGLFRVRAAKERDSEWLELSETDPEVEELQSFQKPNADWMVDGINFESQYLARSLRTYRFFTNVTGRSFMGIKTDKEKGHMDFTHRKRDVILFFLTSVIFYMTFCLTTISFATIIADETQVAAFVNQNQSGKIIQNLTVELLQDQALKAKQDLEELQLELYEIPMYVFLANITLVAVWSILIILGDGIFLTHYFNCWCAALAEMETSGCLGISKSVIMHHVDFLVWAAVLGIMFYLDYPKHIRQVNLLICALIVRPLKPYLRLETDENLLPYQLAGLAFQIYTRYCVMLIKLLMEILATILKNASEMWNFKFALTFQQLATKNRGHLIRMGLNHSLLKLFTHHRILTVLLRNFGEVFSIPIMMYNISEMGVMTIALVRWFFYKSQEIVEAYDGKDSVVAYTKMETPELEEKIEIKYYHPREEVHLILYWSMVQLLFQFIRTTDVLAQAGNSFFAGYEFVRRSGTVLCQNSHQRRLIQSLEWSFSSTNPSVLSANSYYAINRGMILSAFAAVAGFFSLIIQLQVQPTHKVITFNQLESCRHFGLQLYRGTCVVKSQEGTDFSLQFQSKPDE